MIFKLLFIILASHTGFPYLMDAKDIQIYIQTRGLKRQLFFSSEDNTVRDKVTDESD